MDRSARVRVKTAAVGAIFAGCGPFLAIAIFLFQNGPRIADPSPYLGAAVVVALGLALLAFVVGLVLEAKLAGTFLGVAGYVFFSATWIPTTWSLSVAMAAWAGASVVAGVVVAWLIVGSAKLFTGATAALVALCSLLIGLTILAPVTPSERPSDLAFSSELERRPNVYFFVIDAFGRPNVLSEAVDADYSQALGRLEQLGVEVSSDAESNYPATILSVPSMLSGEYPVTSAAEWDAASIFSDGNRVLAGDNSTVDWFRGAGYSYWHASNGVWGNSFCSRSFADECLGAAPQTPFGLVEVTPYRTVFEVSLLGAGEELVLPRPLGEEITEMLESSPDGQPKFVFGHILSPHWPFRYAADCSARESIDFGNSEDDTPEARRQYAEQSICVLDQLATAIETISAVDPTALIMIQGDHGPRFGHHVRPAEWGGWTEAMGEVTFPILRLERLPAECHQDDPKVRFAINAIPKIKACLTGDTPEWIEPRQFLATGEQPHFLELEVSSGG